MKGVRAVWLLILLFLLTMMPFMHHAEGKANDDPAIYLPIITTPAGKWITSYQWGPNDRGPRTVGMLEMGQNKYKLVGSEFVIYLKGDGTVDHATYLTVGGEKIAPLSAGRYVVGSEIWSDHCEIRAALLSEDESTLWNKSARLNGVDCGSGFSLTASDDSIYLHHNFNNQSVSGYSSWLVRLDDQGDLAWSKLVGQDWIGGPFDMAATADGGLIFTAARSSDGYPIIVAELDSAGELVRAREIGPSNGSVYYTPWGISRTADGGTILTGSSDGYEGWAVKLDEKWQIAWQKRYTLPSEAHNYRAQASGDGGVILHTFRNIVKIHADGSVAWARSYGHNTRGIFLNGVKEARDGSVLVTASLQGITSQNYPLSMKLGPDGLVANCDLIRSETVGSGELDLVISPTTVAMQDISAELRTYEPGYTGPVEAGSDLLCGQSGTAGCEE